MAPVITVQRLRKTYGDLVAVDDVSFSVDEGEIFGMVGPNGAGKTSIVECIEGLRTPDGGEIRVLGLDPRRDGRDLHELVGVQLQESGLPDRLKVGEALELYASFYRAPADPGDVLETLGLTSRRGAKYKKLSGGEKQRVSIALALIGRPRVAILDELTTGLDPNARRDTWALIENIRAQGVTILLVTHFMEEAERLCDRVAVVGRGHVLALDTPFALAEHVSAEQRLQFRPSRPFDGRLLTELPQVSALSYERGSVVVTGRGDVVNAVTSVLARNAIVAEQLRVDQPSLEDAFVALTSSGAHAINN